jgi:hypothetical protein
MFYAPRISDHTSLAGYTTASLQECQDPHGHVPQHLFLKGICHRLPAKWIANPQTPGQSHVNLETAVHYPQ